MGLFRRRDETYNQRMLREAGLDRVVFDKPEAYAPAALEPEREPPPGDPPPLRLERGERADRYEREWDAATTATAPGLSGDRVAFTALPGGDLIVGEQEGDGDLSPLADAIEQRLTPPYRAVAARQNGDLWGVGAKRIEVARFDFAAGDTLELTENDGESELRVDGELSGAVAPVGLLRLGERAGGSFCVRASRIDGDFWEVQVSRL